MIPLTAEVYEICRKNGIEVGATINSDEINSALNNLAHQLTCVDSVLTAAEHQAAETEFSLKLNGRRLEPLKRHFARSDARRERLKAIEDEGDSEARKRRFAVRKQEDQLATLAKRCESLSKRASCQELDGEWNPSKPRLEMLMEKYLPWEKVRAPSRKGLGDGQGERLGEIFSDGPEKSSGDGSVENEPKFHAIEAFLSQTAAMRGSLVPLAELESMHDAAASHQTQVMYLHALLQTMLEQPSEQPSRTRYN